MQIHWVGLTDLEDSERSAIEKRLLELAKDHHDLIDLRISGHESRHHKHGAKEIRITCQARGREIVAARTRPELALALAESLDAFEREVRDLREKRREQSRAPERERLHLGIVDRILRDEGYGFILTDDGDQVYFHRHAVKKGLEFSQLKEADRVALNFEPGEKGLQATAVVAPASGEGARAGGFQR